MIQDQQPGSRSFHPFAVFHCSISSHDQLKYIVLFSLVHCQSDRGLVLNAWCLISNYLHLIGSVKHYTLSDILRDFKSFKADQAINAIEQNQQERLKEWLPLAFRVHGQVNSRKKENQLWRPDNQPNKCFIIPLTMHKIACIHQNVVGWRLIYCCLFC